MPPVPLAGPRTSTELKRLLGTSIIKVRMDLDWTGLVCTIG